MAKKVLKKIKEKKIKKSLTKKKRVRAIKKVLKVKKKVVKVIKKKPKLKKVLKSVVAKKDFSKSIGRVTHFFGHIKVAIVKFKKEIGLGSEIYFRGATTDFKEKIKSIQFDHKAISKTWKGKEVGIKVSKKVRQGDEVFEVRE